MNTRDDLALSGLVEVELDAVIDQLRWLPDPPMRPRAPGVTLDVELEAELEP